MTTDPDDGWRVFEYVADLQTVHSLLLIRQWRIFFSARPIFTEALAIGGDDEDSRLDDEDLDVD